MIVGAVLTRSCEEDYFKLCWLSQTGRFTIQHLTSYQFTIHIGIDFTGLLYVKTKNSEDERKQSQKVYVCLFTGASTYAVHLELPGALSVKSFLLPFRRLTITSDNAKTFRSTSQDTRRTAWPEMWRYHAKEQITWNFIIEELTGATNDLFPLETLSCWETTLQIHLFWKSLKLRNSITVLMARYELQLSRFRTRQIIQFIYGELFSF